MNYNPYIYEIAQAFADLTILMHINDSRSEAVCTVFTYEFTFEF